MKELRDPAFTQKEAEKAVGLGVDNRQRGVEEVVKRMEGMAGIEEDSQTGVKA
jgi:bud site selection protein 20